MRTSIHLHDGSTLNFGDAYHVTTDSHSNRLTVVDTMTARAVCQFKESEWERLEYTPESRNN
jgi:hypothetical protein